MEAGLHELPTQVGLLLADGMPTIDAEYALQIASRVLHIVSGR